MKAERLHQLASNGFNVPSFITAKHGEDIPDIGIESELFAVRSSGGEDLENNSHAGEFKTILNVQKADLKDAVEEVFDSYGDSTDGEVIIQKMIDSDISGVIFTANPLGILNEIVIVAGNGLGDNIVDNKEHVTTYYYSIDDKRYIIDKRDNTPILKDSELETLIKLGKDIEGLLGFKSDIEFALKDGEIFILQARPITTLNEYKHKIILDNSNIVESYPGVCLPLTQSFVKDIYYKTFRSAFVRLSKDVDLLNEYKPILKSMVDVVNGRMYYRISNWYSILKLLPNSNKLIKIWQKMLGVKNGSIDYKTADIKLSTKIKIMVKFLYELTMTPKNMEELERYFNVTLEEYRDKLDKANTVLDAILIYNKAKNDFTVHWGVTLINDLYAFINTNLALKLHSQDEISSISEIESMKPLNKLSDLKYTLDRYGEKSAEFILAFDRYIDIYGDRCLEELKLETLTYRTNPEQLLKYISQDREFIRYDTDKDKHKYKGVIRKAQIGIANREKSRMNRSRLFGFTREIFLKIGSLLCNKGYINNSRDIFYLYDSEIFEIEDNRLTKETIKQLVESRKIEYESYSNMDAFSRIEFGKEVISTINYNGRIKARNNSELQGAGVSSGIVSGEVKVLTSPSMSDDIINKIVVAHSTDPGWVFILKDSLGIITEQGSLLSHTAIISRELKKPAVVNVEGATNTLKDGDIVEIDGTTGRIKIIK